MSVNVQLAMLSFSFRVCFLLSYVLIIYICSGAIISLQLRHSISPPYIFLNNNQYMCNTFAFVIGIDPVWDGVLIVTIWYKIENY